MKKTFKERIIKIMEEKNISQSEISKTTGITQSSLSDYIRGKYEPKQDKIDKIAKALGVSPAYLMGWEDTSEPKEPEINTIAAHALEDLTEEEQEKVLEYAKFIKSTRGKNEK